MEDNMTKCLVRQIGEEFKREVDCLITSDVDKFDYLNDFLNHFEIEDVDSKLKNYPIFDFYKTAIQANIDREAENIRDYVLDELKSKSSKKRSTPYFYHKLKDYDKYDQLMQTVAFLNWRKKSFKKEGNTASSQSRQSPIKKKAENSSSISEVDKLPDCHFCDRSEIPKLISCNKCSINPFCQDCSDKIHRRKDKQNHQPHNVTYIIRKKDTKALAVKPSEREYKLFPNSLPKNQFRAPENKKMPDSITSTVVDLVWNLVKQEIQETEPLHMETIAILRYYFGLNMKNSTDFETMKKRAVQELQRKNGVGKAILTDERLVSVIFDNYSDKSSDSELLNAIVRQFDSEFAKFEDRIRKVQKPKLPTLTNPLKLFFYSNKNMILYRNKTFEEFKQETIDLDNLQLDGPECISRSLMIEFNLKDIESANLILEILTDSKNDYSTPLPSIQVVKVIQEKNKSQSRFDIGDHLKILKTEQLRDYEEFTNELNQFTHKMQEVCKNCCECKQSELCFSCTLTKEDCSECTKPETNNYSGLHDKEVHCGSLMCPRSINKMNHYVSEAFLEDRMIPKFVPYCEFPMNHGPFTYKCGNKTYYGQLCEDHHDIHCRLIAQNRVTFEKYDNMQILSQGYPPLEDNSDIQSKLESIRRTFKCPIKRCINDNELESCNKDYDKPLCDFHWTLFIRYLLIKYQDKVQIDLYKHMKTTRFDSNPKSMSPKTVGGGSYSITNGGSLSIRS